MATYSSLNNAGATGTQAGYLSAPTYNQNTGSYGSNSVSPQAKALSNFSMSTPTAPVKKQVITSPDGTVSEQHYDTTQTPDPALVQQDLARAQAQSATSTSNNTNTTPQSGLLNGSYNGVSTPANPPVSPTSPTTPTYGGLIGQGASASQNAATTGSQNYNTANQDLLNSLTKNQEYADKAQQIADAEGQKISDIGGQGAKGEAGYLSTGTSPVAQGNSQLLANSIAAQQQAISQGANAQLSGIDRALAAQGQTQSGLATASGNGLTAQGQGITGLGNNASLAAPQAGASYFGNPLTGGILGSGTTSNGTTGNSLIDSTVQNALQLVKNGADPISAAVMGPLQAIGTPAINAFNNAQLNGGNYNPTTQSATANQNASQAASYQGQATDLDTGLKQLDNVSTLATNFLNTEGLLNPTTNPNINAAINSYVGNFKNPGDRLMYNAILGDISKFTSQILASNNGQIPTAVTSQLQSFDPSTLSATQLLPYLQTLNQLGQNQLSVLQSQTANSQSGSGTGYSGTPTKVNTSPVIAPNEPAVPLNRTGEVVVGGLQNFFGDIGSVIGGIAGKLFSAI